MGIEVVWEDEQNGVLRWNLEQTWTIEDFQQAAITGRRLIESGQYLPRYYTLMVAPDNSQAPVGNMTQMRRLLTEYSDPRERFIRVGGSIGQRTMDIAFLHAFRVFGNRFFYVDTLEKAANLIAEMKVSTDT
jgi:hypothetical protein